VHLDGVSLVVVTSSPQSIVAALPAGLGAGSFRLVVSYGVPAIFAAFDVTIGAVGPPGPQGPAGPQGAQGPSVRMVTLAAEARTF